MITRNPVANTLHPLITGRDLLPQLPRMLSELGLSGKAFVISDTDVLPLYEDRIRNALEDAGWQVNCRAIPAGEESKSIACASELWDWLVDERAVRKDLVIALGGGMVGDLAGWVAATFLRGVQLVQLPTSLLAQVDASVGGKTGINHPKAKNLIGSFYPPALTVVDTSFLATLPERKLREGWAEVIKTALIADPALFDFLCERAADLMALEQEPLAHVVGLCAEIKLRIVTDDPKESGLRAILNYGHTIGHAIEAIAGYGSLMHGEAVAVGMRGAARIAVEKGLLQPEVAERQNRLLDTFDLPASAPGLNPQLVLDTMTLDKKMTSGGLRWVLLRDIGRPELRMDVDADLVSKVVGGLVS